MTRFYFPFDKDGVVENISSKAKVQIEYMPVVNDVIQIVSNRFDGNTTSLFLRGSVSCGRAKPYFSDLDLVCVHRKGFFNQEKMWSKNESVYLEHKYPFILSIEFAFMDLDTLLNSPFYTNPRITLKVNSFCLLGEDITRLLPSVRIGKKLGQIIYLNAETQISNIISSLDRNQGSFSIDGESKPVSFCCRWMMRLLLRSGIALAMINHQVYSNDLETCLYELNTNFPEFSVYFNQAFLWERNPTSNLDELMGYMDEFLPLYNNLGAKMLWNTDL